MSRKGRLRAAQPGRGPQEERLPRENGQMSRKGRPRAAQPGCGFKEASACAGARNCGCGRGAKNDTKSQT